MNLDRSEIRVRLVCAALTGLLADPEDRSDERLPGESCPQAVARMAVEYADATLAQLEKPRSHAP